MQSIPIDITIDTVDWVKVKYFQNGMKKMLEFNRDDILSGKFMAAVKKIKKSLPKDTRSVVGLVIKYNKTKMGRNKISRPMFSI